MFTNKLKKNMAADNRSLFDILEDMRKAEEVFLLDAEKFKKECQSKKLTCDPMNNKFTTRKGTSLSYRGTDEPYH